MWNFLSSYFGSALNLDSNNLSKKSCDVCSFFEQIPSIIFLAKCGWINESRIIMCGNLAVNMTKRKTNKQTCQQRRNNNKHFRSSYVSMCLVICCHFYVPFQLFLPLIKTCPLSDYSSSFVSLYCLKKKLSIEWCINAKHTVQPLVYIDHMLGEPLPPCS